MAKNSTQVRAYGETAVYVAPQYTPTPTDLADPPADFGDLGWMSEDGITMSFTRDTSDVKANGGKVVRRIKSSDARTFKVQCLQTNKHTKGLIYPGSTPSTTGATEEAQTITLTGTGTDGTMTITIPGYGSYEAAYDITAADLAAALSDLVGDTVTAALATGVYTVTFPESAGDLPTMIVDNNITGVSAITVATTTPGVSGTTTTAVKSYVGQDIRAWVLDALDGEIHDRICIPSGEVTAVADISLKGSAETLYELTITPYPDQNDVMYIEISNDPAVAV